jgi:asparagine synthase (glutamine-hydrolysing)
MSAFAVIYERSNTPANLGVLEHVMERLSHRGPDGCDSLVSGNIALGHWHFWTTPEEQGEKQPLALAGLPFKIVLDGRLDNRTDLLEYLHIETNEGGLLSDAALVLYAYAHWGEDCLKYFIGEYALVIVDEQRDQLFCARDALGERTLFYAFRGTLTVIASEPWAVAGALESAPELDELAVVHYFALRATEDGQTLFKGAFELLPAHTLVITAANHRFHRYWQPDLSGKIRYKTDEEYAEHFHSLLEESVRCRMRATTPVGVLMSGGLDSTSIASLAACMIAPQQLTTISYVFDELPGSDERKYINAIQEHWNTRSIQMVCDDYWPFKDWQNWSRNPNQPEINPYWLLNDLAYRRAQAEGSRVLMTGMFGDHLYGARSNWLLDLIGDRRFLDAFRDFFYCIRFAGLKRNWRAGYMQRVILKFFNMLGIKRWHREKRIPSWLMPFSRKAMLDANSRLSDSNENLIGNWTAQRCSSEIFNSSLHSLELRNPYRDRRLIEFVLAIPAYQLFRRGISKYILRTAMKSAMPDLVRLRREYTSFLPLYFHGLEREQSTILDRLRDLNTEWRRFVQQDWILKRWNLAFSPDQDGPHALVPWLCLSYESWYKFICSQNE